MSGHQVVGVAFRGSGQLRNRIVQRSLVALHRRQVQLPRSPVLHVGRGRLDRVEWVAQAKQLGQRTRLEDGLEGAALRLDVDRHLIVWPDLGFTPSGCGNQVAVHHDADRRYRARLIAPHLFLQPGLDGHGLFQRMTLKRAAFKLARKDLDHDGI
ncbi:hypothetical protein D3C81_744290 [compost metagenome]